MVIQSAKLDPNAASYTDDEIVGKVNSATANITRVGFTDMDKVSDGSTNKGYTDTEKTKLGGIAEGAEADQTGSEIRDLILALADTERGLITTDPTIGQFKVVSVERDADGKFNFKYDDVPES